MTEYHFDAIWGEMIWNCEPGFRGMDFRLRPLCEVLTRVMTTLDLNHSGMRMPVTVRVINS